MQEGSQAEKQKMDTTAWIIKYSECNRCSNGVQNAVEKSLLGGRLIKLGTSFTVGKLNAALFTYRKAASGMECLTEPFLNSCNWLGFQVHFNLDWFPLKLSCVFKNRFLGSCVLYRTFGARGKKPCFTALRPGCVQISRPLCAASFSLSFFSNVKKKKKRAYLY